MCFYGKLKQGVLEEYLKHVVNDGKSIQFSFVFTAFCDRLNFISNFIFQKTIDIMKIDIEEFEWEVVPEMIKSFVLRHVRQLTLELHVVDIKNKTEPTKEKYISSLLTLKQLYDFGFRIFWKQSNLCCKFTPSKSKRQQVGCHNLSFVNTQFFV